MRRFSGFHVNEVFAPFVQKWGWTAAFPPLVIPVIFQHSNCTAPSAPTCCAFLANKTVLVYRDEQIEKIIMHDITVKTNAAPSSPYSAGCLHVRSHMRIACALLAVFFMSSSAYAEIEKFAIRSEKGVSFYWWPKLAPIEGWHQDREYSFSYGANALAPSDFTFKDAESVMYARASYKPRIPEIKSLDAFIESDQEDFKTKVPGVSIQEVAPLATGDGQRLRSFTFFPTNGGNWERVSYGEEGEFYLIFTVSSRSQSGFDAVVSTYEKVVRSYKK